MKAFRILMLTLACLAAASVFDSAMAFQDYHSRPVNGREIRAGRNAIYRGRPTTYQNIRESYYSRYSYYNSRPLTYSETHKTARLPIYRSQAVGPAQMSVQTFQNGALTRRPLTPSETLAVVQPKYRPVPLGAPQAAAQVPRVPQPGYINYARQNLIPPHVVSPAVPVSGMRVE